MDKLRPPAQNVTGNETGAGNATNATAGGANATGGEANATNATGAANATNATNSTEGSARRRLQEDNASGNGNATNDTAGNETFWLTEYDEGNFTREQIVLNLTLRRIYDDFALWYIYFFGSDGIIVKNFT